MASKIKVDQIQTLNGSGTIALQNQLSGMTSASMPTGSVLQVKQLLLTTPSSQSLSANTNTVVSGFFLAITPTSTSSKILVTMQWSGESSLAHDLIFGLQVLIPFAAIFYPGMPSNIGSRRGGLAQTLTSYTSSDNSTTMESASFSILYSPNSTESITHKVFANHKDAVTLFNQRSVSDTDATSRERIPSTLQLMEIAG